MRQGHARRPAHRRPRRDALLGVLHPVDLAQQPRRRGQQRARPRRRRHGLRRRRRGARLRGAPRRRRRRPVRVLGPGELESAAGVELVGASARRGGDDGEPVPRPVPVAGEPRRGLGGNSARGAKAAAAAANKWARVDGDMLRFTDAAAVRAYAYVVLRLVAAPVRAAVDVGAMVSAASPAPSPSTLSSHGRFGLRKTLGGFAQKDLNTEKDSLEFR